MLLKDLMRAQGPSEDDFPAPLGPVIDVNNPEVPGVTDTPAPYFPAPVMANNPEVPGVTTPNYPMASPENMGVSSEFFNFATGQMNDVLRRQQWINDIADQNTVPKSVEPAGGEALPSSQYAVPRTIPRFVEPDYEKQRTQWLDDFNANIHSGKTMAANVPVIGGLSNLIDATAQPAPASSDLAGIATTYPGLAGAGAAAVRMGKGPLQTAAKVGYNLLENAPMTTVAEAGAKAIGRAEVEMGKEVFGQGATNRVRMPSKGKPPEPEIPETPHWVSTPQWRNMTPEQRVTEVSTHIPERPPWMAFDQWDALSKEAQWAAEAKEAGRELFPPPSPPTMAEMLTDALPEHPSPAAIAKAESAISQLEQSGHEVSNARSSLLAVRSADGADAAEEWWDAFKDELSAVEIAISGVSESEARASAQALGKHELPSINDINRIVDPATGLRETTQGARWRASTAFGPEMKAGFEQRPEMYLPRSSEELAQRAAVEVYDDPLSVYHDLMGKDVWTDADVKKSGVLLSEVLLGPDEYAAREALARKRMQAGRASGQTVQAFDGPLSPDGVEAYAARIIDDARRGGTSEARIAGSIRNAAEDAFTREANEARQLTEAELKLVEDYRKAGDPVKQAEQLNKTRQRVGSADDIATALEGHADAAVVKDAVDGLTDLKRAVRGGKKVEQAAAAVEEQAARTAADMGVTYSDLPDLAAQMKARQDALKADMRIYDKMRQGMVLSEADMIHLQNGVGAGVFDSMENIAERTAFARAANREYDAARRAMVIAEAKKTRLDNLVNSGHALTTEEIAERAAAATDYMRAYDRARQVMIDAEAKQIRIANRVAEGVSEGFQEMADRTQVARGFSTDYNRTRQAMIDAEAKTLRVQNMIASGVAPDLPTLKAAHDHARTELAQMRKYHDWIQWLTDASTRAVKKKAATLEQETINRIRATLRPTGVELPYEFAMSLVDRAKKLRELENFAQGTDEAALAWSIAKSMNHDIGQVVPKKWTHKVLEALGLPTAWNMAYDLSIPFRQGLLLASDKAWWTSWKPMLEAVANPQYYNSIVAYAHTQPHMKELLKAGLALPEPMGGILHGVEGYASGIPAGGRIRGDSLAAKALNPMLEVYNKTLGATYRGSQRGAEVYITKLRADAASNMAKAIGGGAPLDEAEYKAIADYVNIMSGHGKLGPRQIDEGAAIAGRLMFTSARNWASRLEAPFIALAAPMGVVRPTPQLSRRVATELSKQAGREALLLGSIAAVAAASGAHIELDPRSTDFLKIRVGNSRYDFLAQEATQLRYVAQMLMSEVKGATGQPRPLTDREVNDLQGQYIRSKLNPLLGLVNNARMGNSATGGKQDLMKDLVEMLTPGMTIEDSLAAMKAHEMPLSVPMGAAAAAGSFLGVGVSSYESLPDLRDRVSRAKGYGDYAKATPSQQAAVDQDERVREAQNNLAPVTEIASKDAGAMYEARRKAIQDEFVKNIEVIKDPKARRQSVSDLLENQAKAYADTIGNPLVKRVDQKPDPAAVAQVYRDRYMAVQPVVTEDGADMKAFYKQRQDIVNEAVQAGVDPKEVTFHRPLANAAAEKEVAEYRADQERLKEYLDMRDQVIEKDPLLRQRQAEADAFKKEGDLYRARIRQSQVQEYVTHAHKVYLRDHIDVERILDKWGYPHPRVR